MKQLYIIEARTSDGKLDFTDPQPESVFGMAAIDGIDDHAMAQAIFRNIPGALMTGDTITKWPSILDPRWVARRKT